MDLPPKGAAQGHRVSPISRLPNCAAPNAGIAGVGDRRAQVNGRPDEIQPVRLSDADKPLASTRRRNRTCLLCQINGRAVSGPGQ